MKIAKKLGLLVAVFVVFGLILAGCSSDGSSSSSNNNGNSSSSEQSSDSGKKSSSNQSSSKDSGGKEFSGKTLNVAAFKGGYGAKYWKALAKAFEKDYPGVTVKINASPNIGKKIRPKILAGNAPDFVYLNANNKSGLTRSMIKNHAMAELTDVFNSMALNKDVKLKKRILPGILNTSMTAPYGNGKIYMAPYNYNVMGLWYNQHLFEKKGIKPPQTWDQFFAYNEKAKKLDRALFTYQGIYPGYLAEIVVPAIYDVGGKEALNKFFTYDPSFWDTKAASKVLGIFETIATTKNMLMKGTVALTHTQAQTAFLKGEAMFIPNGSWFPTEMKNAPREDGFEYGFLGIPSFKKGDPKLYQVSVEQVWIPKQAKDKKLAKEFLKYMYTKKSVILNAKKAGAVMAVKGAAQAAKPYISKTAYHVFNTVDKKGMTPVASAWKPLPENANFSPKTIFFDQVAKVMHGEMTAKEWAQKMTEVYKKAQKAYKQAD